MSPRRRAWPLLAIVAAVILVAAGIAFVLLRQGDDPPPSVSLHAGDEGVRVAATRWCPDGKTCRTHKRTVPVLRLAGKSDVVIDVAAPIRTRPWLVLVDGTSASPLQRRSASYRLIGVTGPLLVEVVTVDTDGKVVLQRDRWIFRVENR